MNKKHIVHCDCNSVTVSMLGNPRVHAYCHCEDCRTLLDVPYHSLVAWDGDKVSIESGEEFTVVYQHPTLDMTRVFCNKCGETLYNTNAKGWKVVSQLLIQKCNNDELPEEFHSNAHFFYDRRIIDLLDQIAKND